VRESTLKWAVGVDCPESSLAYLPFPIAQLGRGGASNVLLTENVSDFARLAAEQVGSSDHRHPGVLIAR